MQKMNSRSDRVFDAVNISLLVLLTILVLYPLYFTVIASVSDPYAISEGEVVLWPVKPTLGAYRAVFQDDRIWRGYGNSILYTGVGTLFSLLLTLTAAYTLSKKKLVGRQLLAVYFLIPMYFSGGLVPTYLQIKNLGLLNRPYTLIVLGGLNIFNLVVTRVYFETAIPGELYESAAIDGAREFRMFFSIALPLAKSVIAVIALYYAVERWNDFFTPLIYLSKDDYMPMQIVLRSILLLNQTAYETMVNLGSNVDSRVLTDFAERALLAESMKYALIFISSAPLLILYPFVQKYFVKGLMIGALKG